ncbi:MAG: nuclear transport factor 2 family protein [Oscillospiraceae bacterium]|nr:nuclear transport factor 2 family protein [Oscillospiraceae bacterium]
MDELMLKKLQNLLDKVAIEDKIKLYAQNLDTKNWDNMKNVFMSGAHID